MGGLWNPAIHERNFWLRVDRTADCWLWTGKKHNRGYGELRVDNKTWRAHRYAYWLTHRSLPDVVRHTCDTPLCVRPEHLLAGTQADNVADRDDRQRRQHFRGVDNGNAKFTNDDVIAIRAAYADGSATQVALARQYSVSQGAISRCVRNASFQVTVK